MVDAKTGFLVIGGGAVGLAITRRIAMAEGAGSAASVIMVEANPHFGMETSSRNSEVIHAGIYYPTGSMKARLCVAGARAMYAFCESHGVTTRRCGKLIVASEPGQEEKLLQLKAKGEENEVPQLAMLSRREALAMEPELVVEAALHSPVSGVVDSHNYMAALEGDADNHGAIIAYQSRFVGARRDAEGWVATIESQGETMQLGCHSIINAAGHGAIPASLTIEGMDSAKVPQQYFAKGQYFSTTRKPPFKRLIYPLPSGGGLGIHLTLDSGNGARFGPDIHWVETPSYDVNPDDAAIFHQLISSYWPALQPEELVPAWAGVRPKIVADGSAFQDFRFATEAEHGCAGVIALYGIDSPGLTSSLAIADHVAELSGLVG